MLLLYKEKSGQTKGCISLGGFLFCTKVSVFCVWPGALIFFCLFVSILFPAVSLADIYKYKDKNGVLHFTNIRPDARYTLYIKEAKENPDAFITRYDDIIEAASEKFSMEPSLIKAVIKAESGFDHNAVSSKGAQGLMQLMPGTASDMEVDDPYNPEKNIFGGTKYLCKMMEKFKNDVRLALAAYNAGPDKVDQYKDVPPYKETKTFIERVMKYYDQYKAAE
ncbi:MAG: lytic transglycosylase domain-containing protein [Deltaproteobacteria bacterium]|nr:lytic transglycosylase domain-containing protein [Deltaproteobacteria bacterium]